MLSKKEQALTRKKARIRKKIFGTAERPRMIVRKSNKYIYVSVVDDVKNKMILCISTGTLKLKNSGNIKAATALGEAAAKKAISLGVKQIVFDRGGYIYHGKIRALADAARAGGLKF